MASPFPGMDPYLEAPGLWPDVHNSLIFAIREQLQPRLSPRYVAVTTPYIDYRQAPPLPELSAADAAWVAEVTSPSPQPPPSPSG